MIGAANERDWAQSLSLGSVEGKRVFFTGYLNLVNVVPESCSSASSQGQHVPWVVCTARSIQNFSRRGAWSLFTRFPNPNGSFKCLTQCYSHFNFFRDTLLAYLPYSCVNVSFKEMYSIKFKVSPSQFHKMALVIWNEWVYCVNFIR